MLIIVGSGFVIQDGFAEKEGILLKQDENVYINNYNYYPMLGGTENLGFTAQSVIFGDVINISENDVYYVVLRVNVYDENKLIVTDLDFPTKLHLRSGESSTFAIFPEWTGWDCFELWVEDYKFATDEESEITKKIRDSLEVSMKDIRGQLKIKIKNNDSITADGVTVVVTKYDKEDNIIGMFWDYHDKINPGKTVKSDISAYLDNYKSTSQLEKYIYEKPERIEIEVYGFNGFYLEDITEFVGKWNDVKFIKYYQQTVYQTFTGTNLSKSTIGTHIDLDSIQNSLISELKEPPKKGYCTSEYSSPNPPPVLSSISVTIPSWIKNNAGWWAEDEIDDTAFLTGISYMISNKIIQIPQTEKVKNNYDELINKLTSYYDKFKAKWAKVLSQRKKTKNVDEV